MGGVHSVVFMLKKMKETCLFCVIFAECFHLLFEDVQMTGSCRKIALVACVGVVLTNSAVAAGLMTAERYTELMIASLVNQDKAAIKELNVYLSKTGAQGIQEDLQEQTLQNFAATADAMAEAAPKKHAEATRAAIYNNWRINKRSSRHPGLRDSYQLRGLIVFHSCQLCKYLQWGFVAQSFARPCI